MDPPLISVITPTFNSGAKIASTVASVLSQRKALYEFLVIDGGSTDSTLQHLLAQGSALRWLSEPDEGIYDAMNKGIRLTSGEFLYFLGAGDRLLPGMLEAVAGEIRKLQCQGKTSRPTLLYGNVDWSCYSRPYDGRFNRFKLFRRNICQQAIFYQRSVFDRLGYYNTKYRLLADWEFNIRCFNDRGVHKCYIPLRIADYEGGGTSAITPDLAFQADFPRIARSWWAEAAVFHARELLVKVGFAPAWRQIVEALRLSHSPRVIRKIFSFLVLWLRIIGSRVKGWMRSKFKRAK
jgi:glycosyltransferase involved in cell wall biosynthesis